MRAKQIFRIGTYGFLSGLFISGLILTLSQVINQRNHLIPLASNTIVLTIPLNSSSSDSDGRIDLNQATVLDLESLPGIGSVKAEAIITFRQKYGSFEDVSELLYVPGIGTGLYNSIKEMVIISQ